MKKYLIISLFTIFIPVLTIAQDQVSSLKLTRELHFEKESAEQVVYVDVSESTETIFLQINARVEDGKLEVKIYDPHGKKQGSFSVGTQIKKSSKNREIAQGEFNKEIKKPEAGKWKIVVTPSEAQAIMSIISGQTLSE